MVLGCSERILGTDEFLIYGFMCELRMMFESALTCISEKVKELLNESPRRWQGAFGLNNTCLLGSRLMQLYLLISRHPHHVRILQHVHVTPSVFMRWDKPRNLTYLLLTVENLGTYGGKTNWMLRRMSEHLRQGYNGAANDEEFAKLYSRMKRLGAHNFFYIILSPEISNLKREEIRMIKMLRPSLNTAHVPRQRRKGRKRPVIEMRKRSIDGNRTKRAKIHTCRTYVMEYNVNDTEGIFLEILLDNYRDGESIQISWDVPPGAQRVEYSDWNVVRRVYGKSTLVLPHEWGANSLLNLLDKIRGEPTGVASFLLRRDSLLSNRQQTLREIVTNPGKWIRKLTGLPLRSLLQFMLVARTLKNTRLREKCAERIQDALKRRYHISSIISPVIRIPYRGNAAQGAGVRAALSEVLMVLQFPNEVIKEVSESIRVVLTKRDSIADMTHNYIKEAKTFSLHKPPVCVCANGGDHKVRLPEDFEGEIGKVLGQNSKNIPYPSSIDAQDELRVSFLDALAQVQPMIDQRQENIRQFATSGRYCPDSGNLSRRFQRRDPAFARVFKLLSRVVEFDVETLKCGENWGISVEAVKQVARALRGHVLVFCDKNIGKTAVMCPKDYHERLHTTFIQDSGHYESAYDHVTDESLVKLYIETFYHKQWKGIAPLRAKGTIPYAYVVPKFKDLNRNRPLISYFNHPLKNVFQVTQRALMFLTKQWPARKFTLSKTGDFVTRIHDVETQLSTVFGEDTRMIPVLADIKEMFTNLSHASIMEAVKAVIEHATRQTRSQYVKVPKSKLDDVAFGKSANRHTAYEICFKQILEVVRFDLDYAFFNVGKEVRHQIQGCPIGGIVSCAYSIVTCEFAEYSWIATLGSDSKFISLIRYIDDVNATIAYKRGDRTSYLRAQRLRYGLFKDCYPKSLDLKEENVVENTYRFLETTTTLRDGKFRTVHFQKNHEELLTKNRQKFFTLKNSSSYDSRAGKKGVLIARLIAIKTNCSDNQGILSSCKKFFQELVYLGYSKSMIRDVCRVMTSKDYDDIWHRVAHEFIHDSVSE